MRKYKKRLIMLLLGVLGAILGAFMGAGLLPMIWERLDQSDKQWLNNPLTNGVTGAFIALLLVFVVGNIFVLVFNYVEKLLSEQTLGYLVFGGIGGVSGLVSGAILTIPMYNTRSLINGVFAMVIIMGLGFLGFRVGTTRIAEWRKVFVPKHQKFFSEAATQFLGDKNISESSTYKILDTSVIIDGRIYDIVKTGFLEGTLLIPNFVLFELQHIADSSDNLKRIRGRRGLDILNSLQREATISVEMWDGDFEEVSEVDSKLIRLAKELDGMIVTNDYNLNKVSEFQNVAVLNINALANAVKPVVIPGETMNVRIVKAGTEREQGVAYLDDGTMVVVEEGLHHINELLHVVVTSSLQTAAGRMIFAKPVHSQENPSKQFTEEES